MNHARFKRVVEGVLKKYRRNQRTFLKHLRSSSLHPSYMEPLQKEFVKLRNKYLRLSS